MEIYELYYIYLLLHYIFGRWTLHYEFEEMVDGVNVCMVCIQAVIVRHSWIIVTYKPNRVSMEPVMAKKSDTVVTVNRDMKVSGEKNVQ